MAMTDEEARRREAAARQRDARQDLAKVLEAREGQRVLARILWELGMGRTVAAEETATLNAGQRLFERLKAAAPGAAARVLNMVYRLEE